jgi:hypothetical protein
MKLAYALPCVFALSLSSLTGCGGHKEYMHAQAVTSPDITVQPLEIWIGGKKLWVRVNVQNNSKSVVVVNRDAMTAHLGNGRTVGRAMGSYTQHEPYNIMPGSFHPVYVEFSQEGFNWHEVGPVQIDFTGAVLKDGAPVAVPPLVAAP